MCQEGQDEHWNSSKSKQRKHIGYIAEESALLSPCSGRSDSGRRRHGIVVAPAGRCAWLSPHDIYVVGTDSVPSSGNDGKSDG